MASFYGDHPRSAVLKIGTSEASSGEQDVSCAFGGMDGRTLRLDASEEVAVHVAAIVEYSDAIFLGEVVDCTRVAGETWEVSVKVSQILTGLHSLCNLRVQLAGEHSAVSRGFIPAGGGN